ncbi:ATP-binding protein [Litoribacillus peritrichatus]|uniref:histidine kinase n=1 Tax=Litoribacillus peritrichatus TaxID=718191 RepID=A0ABP7M852_9GAMM
MTLRVQLALLLLLVTFLPIAIFTYQNQQTTSQQYIASKDAALMQAKSLMADAIDDYIKITQEVLWSDSYISVFREFLEGDPNSRQRYFSEVYGVLRTVVVKDSVFVNSAALLDHSGENLMDTSAYIYTEDESVNEYYRSVIETGDSYFSTRLVKDLLGHALYVSSPIKNTQGEVLGLLRLRIDSNRFQYLISKSLRDFTFDAILWDEAFVQLANLRQPLLVGTQGHDPGDMTMNKESFQHQTPVWFTLPDGRELRMLRATIKTLPWTLELSQDKSEFTAILDENYRQWLVQLALVFIVTLVGAIVVATYFVWPIKRVGLVAERIASGDYKARVPVFGSIEVRGMANSLKKMTRIILSNLAELEVKHNDKVKAERALLELNADLESRVEERTKELLAANEEKREALALLVQSEKMAELGNLVAGVTHEVNTPLGNNVTVASSLGDQLKAFKKLDKSGKLTHSDLKEFLKNCEFAAEVLQKNCQRASELMGSFKRVAVDQTSMRRRTFSLADSVNEVITTLHSTLKKYKHEIHVDIPMELVLDSYPGPLDQVLTNLINNSLIHAFKSIEVGHIHITAGFMEGFDHQRIEMIYKDDGVGIPEASANQVFDPFYTTLGNEGGSGIGLYLIKSLVENELGGAVFLDVNTEKGVVFVFELPIKAPVIQKKS